MTQQLSFRVIGYYYLKSQDRYYVCVIASTNGKEYIAQLKSGNVKEFAAKYFDKDVTPDNFKAWTARYSKAPNL